MNRSRKRGLRHLLVGPLPPPIGGTTVLFAQLVNELRTYPDIHLSIIDTSRRSNGVVASAVQAAVVSYRILRTIASCDIASFHSSRRGAALLGPIVWFLCRLFKKPWIFRGFGDIVALHRAHGVYRLLFDHSVLYADAVLVETKSAVEYFHKRTTADVQWYANSRPNLDVAKIENDPRSSGSRFVFVGHVKPSKGVRQLIEATEMLEDVTVDVYGPLLEGMQEHEFFGKRTHYCGPLAPERVGDVLRMYDALVLPTYYEGEGYPGSILEAYAQGIPVIASRWRSIPEIVTERSGLLVEPGDAVSLAEAMRSLTSADLRRELRSGAQEMAAAFSSRLWTARFVQISSDLAATYSTTDGVSGNAQRE